MTTPPKHSDETESNGSVRISIPSKLLQGIDWRHVALGLGLLATGGLNLLPNVKASAPMIPANCEQRLIALETDSAVNKVVLSNIKDQVTQINNKLDRMQGREYGLRPR